jgi:peptide-methionine (S)-S-oxide reductase
MIIALLAGSCAPAAHTPVAAEVPSDTAPTSTAVDDPQPDATVDSQVTSTQENATMPEQTETATLGAGCFWCVESVLLRIKGVQSVTSGYAGGDVANPSYDEVCTGRTGHAEVVQITFDPTILPFDKLLDVFWQLHDPTTLNRQGPDIGTQYRSVIFYHSPEQRETAIASKEKWDKTGKFQNPIVTEITEAPTFYPAESYHQDFFNKNPTNIYCRINILPKFKKLGLLKESDAR